MPKSLTTTSKKIISTRKPCRTTLIGTTRNIRALSRELNQLGIISSTQQHSSKRVVASIVGLVVLGVIAGAAFGLLRSTFNTDPSSGNAVQVLPNEVYTDSVRVVEMLPSEPSAFLFPPDMNNENDNGQAVALPGGVDVIRGKNEVKEYNDGRYRVLEFSDGRLIVVPHM